MLEETKREYVEEESDVLNHLLSNIECNKSTIMNSGGRFRKDLCADSVS